MGSLERRQREKEEMREAILETAMQLFVEEGYDATTIRRIAEKIEYTPGSIYSYYKDKDEIFYELHRRAFQKFYEAMRAAHLSSDDPMERLYRIGETYIRFALENPKQYDLMFIMRSTAAKITEDCGWQEGERTYDLLRNAVKECLAAGLIKDDGLGGEGAAFACWAMVHGLVSLFIRGRCAMFPNELLPHLIRSAYNFSMANIANQNIARMPP